MSNEIVKSDDPNAMAALQAMVAEQQPLANQKDFDTVSKVADYFARIQLSGSNSKLCKRGLVPMGTFTFVMTESNYTDLTKEVDVLPVAWRPKALDTGGETPMSVYDTKSQAFQTIQDRADNEDDSGCCYGPEFLCWIPSIQKFATYHLGSRSARQEAKPMLNLLGKGVTLSNVLAKKGKWEWHAPVISPCTRPFQMPDMEELKANMTKFKKEQTAAAPEQVDAPATDRAR